MNLWPSQQRALDGARQACREGHRAICVVGPTGCGKTIITVAFGMAAAGKNKTVGVLTNRKILLDQASRAFTGFGLDHGIMASGHEEQFHRAIQILSVQTIEKRVFGTGRWELPLFDILLVDEAHSNTGVSALKIIDHHKANGATVIGFTATPVGLSGVYTKIVEAGTYSELQAAGKLVKCTVFAPSEPDMKGVRMTSTGEYSDKAARKRLRECEIYGDVLEHWRKLNPFRLPTVVFAPGIEESLYIVENIFRANGVTAEHIDGDTPDEERQRIFHDVERGVVTAVSSCGVLREGWNLPCISHGILLQPCGGLSTYIQIAGRIMRAAPGKDMAVLQDHAGAWHRHGAPDADRDWSLEDDDKTIAKAAKADKESGKVKEPICCPKCAHVREYGPKCPACGHEHKLSVRKVREIGGTLKKMHGQVVKKKREKTDEDHWRTEIFVGKRLKRSMAQCAKLFETKHGHPLPSSLAGIRLPSPGSVDWRLRVDQFYE